jgi:hypothetical protein
MIEANELRRNNCFYFSGITEGLYSFENEVGVLRLNDQYKYYVEFKNISNELLEEFSLEQIKPIPLTATILEQSGFIKGKPFEKTGHVPYHDKEYKGFVIIDCLDGTFWLADYKPYDVKIEFVHWLQNVYYFLIGSELNIQL